jgi:hypothetical protein
MSVAVLFLLHAECKPSALRHMGSLGRLAASAKKSRHQPPAMTTG